ncbi:MAG: tRNA (N(6)-L-threonylcarbamoyladenosine(37)-C(2))-methylthiotransferase MtaB, partial [Clostridia bacterium]|nr:tRNA (N(6)-L-threonylcarbamoyladenosine(37)-C(2))-methylthiotransferase MtaB [Clostridia bacterium]
MKAALYTLGCKVNQYETQIMEQRLRAAGYEIAGADEAADVFVVNSCTVTAQSDAKCRKLLHRLRRMCPDALIVLTGCMPQAAPEAATALTQADVVTGTQERAVIDEVIAEALRGGRRVRIAPHEPGERF